MNESEDAMSYIQHKKEKSFFGAKWALKIKEAKIAVGTQHSDEAGTLITNLRVSF